MDNHERSTSPAGVWLALVVVCLIVAGLAGIAIVTYSRAPVSLSPGANVSSLLPPLRISTAAAGIHCPTDLAISPDGLSLFIIGVRGACDPATGLPLDAAPHVAAIFAARSGNLLTLTPLEPLLGLDHRQLHATAATLRFFGLGWSPDGTHIALVYTAFDADSSFTPDHVLDSGLLVLGTQRSVPTVIHGDSGYFPSVGGGSAGFPIWDLSDETEMPAAAIVPGLAYTWGQARVPTPLVPLRGPLTHLPINAGPRYPVGNPDGGSSFTIWQPGVVVGAAQAGSLGNGRAVFLTVFSTWSPDGMRLAVLSAGVALAPPAGAVPAAGRPSAGGSLPLPTPAIVAQTPSRDAALDAIQRQIGGDGSALVAWNPPGDVLASIPCGAGSRGATLLLRSTLSGAVLSSTALEPSACGASSANPSGGAYPDRPVTLLWSADGHSVLVCDRAADSVQLWPVR